MSAGLALSRRMAKEKRMGGEKDALLRTLYFYRSLKSMFCLFCKDCGVFHEFSWQIQVPRQAFGLDALDEKAYAAHGGQAAQGIDDAVDHQAFLCFIQFRNGRCKTLG